MTHSFVKKFTNEVIKCTILSEHANYSAFGFRVLHYTVATKYGVMRCVTDLVKL